MRSLENCLIQKNGRIVDAADFPTNLSINKYDYIVNNYGGHEGLKVDRINDSIIDMDGKMQFKISPFGTIVKPYEE